MTLDISTTTNSHDPQNAPTVAAVQTLLMHMGISVGSSGADGWYGGNTEAAVKIYQRRKGLDDDGVVGHKTWDKLSGDHAPIGGHTFGSASRMADICLARVTGRDGHPRPTYRFGARVTNLSEKYPLLFDCSELPEWGIYQVTGKDWADGTFNQAPKCQLIPVTQGINTKGALLFITSNGTPTGAHHVAISMGNGMTAEARSTAAGCGSWPAKGRFNMAGLVPILDY